MLLNASSWEIKFISHYFRKYYGLNFWATIIERITEYRVMLNKKTTMRKQIMK